MKYFIKARWWRSCHAMPTRFTNLVIGESPELWLDRQRRDRLGYPWTDIVIDFCCPIENDAEVSPEPYLGDRPKPLSPEQEERLNRFNRIFWIGLLLASSSLALSLSWKG